MTEALKGWLKSGVFVGIATDQPTRAAAVLSQVEIFPGDHEGKKLGAGAYLIEGNPAGGFIAPKAKTDSRMAASASASPLRTPQTAISAMAPNSMVPNSTTANNTPGSVTKTPRAARGRAGAS